MTAPMHAQRAYLTPDPLVPEPVRRLEELLGNPWDADNPVGYAAVLAADERGEPLELGERLLDDFGLPAHYVPVALGGRLGRLDELVAVLRSACRRDPVLAFGHGLNSLMAAVNVWCLGDDEQRRTVADVLLDGGRIACAYHELDHGNDLSRMDFTAAPDRDGWRLTGRKEVITNIARAQALVVFARTDPRPGSRSHSLFLLDRAAAAAGGARPLARYPLSGLRGVHLGGIEFFDSPVPAGTLVGRPGQGLEIAVRSFQVTRLMIPGMAIGALDTALRVGVRYARGRHLYGAPVAELALVRSEFAGVLVDLLVADCLVAVGARLLSLSPREGSTFTAAVKYLVPQLLVAAADRLAAVLGAQFYLRSGPNGLLQKLVRDLAPTSFVHASATSCQLTLLPQLPLLARRGWQVGTEPDPRLFDLRAPLPDLDVTALTVGFGGTDSVLGVLLSDRWKQLVPADDARTHRLAEALADDAAALVEACRDLEPEQLGVTCAPAVQRLTYRYAVLLAAACCLEVGPAVVAEASALGHGFLPAALARLSGLLGHGDGALDVDLVEGAWTELVHRFESGRTFDLAAAQLPSTQQPDPLPEGLR